MTNLKEGHTVVERISRGNLWRRWTAPVGGADALFCPSHVWLQLRRRLRQSPENWKAKGAIRPRIEAMPPKGERERSGPCAPQAPVLAHSSFSWALGFTARRDFRGNSRGGSCGKYSRSTEVSQKVLESLKDPHTCDPNLDFLLDLRQVGPSSSDNRKLRAPQPLLLPCARPVGSLNYSVFLLASGSICRPGCAWLNSE